MRKPNIENAVRQTRSVLECGDLSSSLPTSPRDRFLNPEGIEYFSPGLRGTSYPGSCPQRHRNPERVASNRSSCDMAGGNGCNPFRVERHCGPVSQGSSRTRNPGLSAGIPLGFKRPQPRLVGHAKDLSPHSKTWRRAGARNSIRFNARSSCELHC
jgi:hypothetical protein